MYQGISGYSILRLKCSFFNSFVRSILFFDRLVRSVLICVGKTKMMKLLATIIVACIGFVLGLEECPQEVYEAIWQLQNEDPDYMSCLEHMAQFGVDPQLYCHLPPCQRGTRKIYDAFPDDCQAGEWLDFNDKGELVPTTKASFAANAMRLCPNWTFT